MEGELLYNNFEQMARIIDGNAVMGDRLAARCIAGDLYASELFLCVCKALLLN